MLRYVLGALALITSVQVAAPQDDVNSALARAEQLYYEARFREAVDLLLPIDAALGSQPEGLQDKIKVKLQLALAHASSAHWRLRAISLCTSTGVVML